MAIAELKDFLEINPSIFIFGTIIFGLCIGSFINVVIYRLPLILNNIWHDECVAFLELEEKEDQGYEYISLLYPKSHCPRCEYPLKWYHKFPLLSYVLLRGKCANCNDKVSIRYPAIELLTAILFAIQALYFGPHIELFASFLLTTSLIALSVIDLDHRIIPDQITLPILWIGLNINIFNIFTSLEEAVIGATLGYIALWIFVRIYEVITGKFAMGHGDFKLLAVAGAWFGWQQLPIIVLISSFLGSLIGIILILLKINTKDTKFPFGPYLAFATWFSLIWGDNIMISYLSYFELI